MVRKFAHKSAAALEKVLLPTCLTIPVSASPIPSMFNPDVICRALSIEDIQQIMKQFAFSAKLVKDAGVDAYRGARSGGIFS